MLANSQPWVDGIVGVGENKRSYTLSAVVYDMCIIYYKKALRFLAILGVVWETVVLKNRNCCSQLS